VPEAQQRAVNSYTQNDKHNFKFEYNEEVGHGEHAFYSLEVSSAGLGCTSVLFLEITITLPVCHRYDARSRAFFWV